MTSTLRPRTAGPTRDQIAELLSDTRERTLLLVGSISDEDLRTQHDPIMGPILWDLAHIVSFEELWLLRNIDRTGGFEALPNAYNAFETPRSARGDLDLPGLDEAVETMAEVRRRVLERLGSLDLGARKPLPRDGFVFRMVAQHEAQHQETILQTLQLKRGEPYRPPRRRVLPGGEAATGRHAGMIRFPGGEVPIGTDDRGAAYDNERPRHTVRLEPFRIDAAPVTNGEYMAFMGADSYERREFWSDDGWHWLRRAGARAPKYWFREGGQWRTRVMDRAGAVDPERPVCHVCYHEAEAYARWAGKRLPAEHEWEAAASWDPERGVKRPYPWGGGAPTDARANLDQLGFCTAPVGAYPGNVSPIGCYGMIGDVWEWTASDFRGYPGFESFPYDEYSRPFFGSDYKVLRGGSWATSPVAIRNTFRNWDYPIRRQIFSGFRCARDG